MAERRFLVATGNVGYQWDNSNVWFTAKDGDDEEWHYPLGRMIDRFTAAAATACCLCTRRATRSSATWPPGSGS